MSRLTLFLGLVFLFAASAPAQSLPEGKGKAEFQRICGQCHGVEMVIKLRMSEDRWAGMVDDMVSRGAQGTQDDFDRVTHYLGVNFGPEKALKIGINKATAKELEAGLGISAEAAAAIVQCREKNGPFKEWRDLEKAPGLDLKKLEDKKDRIDFSAPTN